MNQQYTTSIAATEKQARLCGKGLANIILMSNIERQDSSSSSSEDGDETTTAKGGVQLSPLRVDLQIQHRLLTRLKRSVVA